MMTDINQSKTTSKYQPALYIISTPIGNLGDITLRAIEALKHMDFLACEDTRVTKQLLSHLDITPPRLLTYNDFSTEKDRRKLVELVTSGHRVGLVSDAGTPLISDPGYKLIQDAQEYNIPVECAPGVSSVITALTLAGLPTDSFFFDGFLPSKSTTRQKRLNELASIPATIVCFESSRRLVSTLEDIHATIGNRKVSVCRELTKKFEETKNGTAQVVADYYRNNPPKGEVVLLISGHEHNEEKQEADMEVLLQQALETMSVKDAASYVSELVSVHKKQIYNKALELKKNTNEHS
jgi:16S rRNA (cytidine1402-2'-O)-methyltransferase